MHQQRGLERLDPSHATAKSFAKQCMESQAHEVVGIMGARIPEVRRVAV